MRDIEHKAAQEEPATTPEQKGIATNGRQKPPRAWRYLIIGVTVLIALALIFAGALALANRGTKQSPVAKQTPTTGATTLPTTTIRATTLPTPASKPIPAPPLSDRMVNMTIAGGVAYLSISDSYPDTSKNGVFALSTSNGALLWHQNVEGSADQAPLVANGVVYVTSYVGEIGPAYTYALRASDGSVLWRYSNDNYSYLSLSPSDSNVVYIASPDGISALNTANGASLWHFAAKDTGSTWPLEVNSVVYFSSSSDNGSGTLYVLRAADGSLIWQHKTGSYTNTPVVANGVVYISLDGGVLAALRASDGYQLWKRAIDANFLQSSQLVNGVLYTTATKILEPPAARSTSPLQGAAGIGALLWNTFQNVPSAQAMPHKQGLSSVYAIRASDGAVLWHYVMNNGANSWASWLAIENGIVYASAITDTTGSQGLGDIYAFQSSNGSILWHDKLHRSPSNATLVNGIIYLSTSAGSSDGALYALRARDGSLLWDYPTSGAMFAAPILDSNAIYFSANNGMAYALRAANGTPLWHYLTQLEG